MRHGTTPHGLFQQNQAHSPSFFSVARAMGRHADDLADFCIPCNPYFPTDAMFGELERNLRTILKFYPSEAAAITAQLASVLRLNPSTISLANGSTELITWIDQLLVDSSVAVPIPTFGRWTDQPMETGKRVDMFLLKEADNFELRVDEYIEFIKRRGSRVAVLCNPNNPDGGYLPRREVLRFMDALEDLDLVVIDESFVDFVEVERNPSVAAEAVVRPNVIVLKSLGKNFGLHGIRFGYQVSNPALTRKLSAALPKWNLNSLAETVIFMLAEHHLLVRQCGNKIGMTSQFMRFGVRPDTEVERLVEGLRGVERLGGGRHTTPAIELVSHSREPERSIS
ncbi:aminotransferase class I/II-fold pyridoxal phosphate-dependent enzyme [Amycolatopsis sp. NPDC051716]|uniref:pyridoxal phosphate-dependent aminotransferase n=1 Tax=Amycolatopsis sp. NPDC051716 TaxID=3155804 RepID=UPI003432EFAF